MNSPTLRWGILGAAEIARKNWKAIREAGDVIVAVASRDGERARRFVSECQSEAPFDAAPAALGSYDALLARADVDAVYIPLPTGVRKEWVVRAANAGKHVVCEKPCARDVADLREMIEACRRNGVQFMDGVMFVHSQRLERMREALEDGKSVGQIRRIQSAFSFRAPEEFFSTNIRAHSALEPHGCVGDLGWYCIRFALWAMKWEMPRQVCGRLLATLGSIESPAPVPTEFSGELLFEGGVSAGFYCSFVTDLEQWVRVSGTTGSLRVDDFVLPFSGSELSFDLHRAAFRVRGCDFDMKPETHRLAVAEHSHGHADAQEANLFRNFATAIRSGRLNEQWPEMALKTQQIMNACLESANAEGQPIEPLQSTDARQA
ncbi:MAG TPA: Gfo/Idh/MocA family oxidoreductase [Verrucomicrobiae bacterium]|nr:Gfo/Idh/MocA family oxidoreductase [Verrucomicrobiae bacterium]